MSGALDSVVSNLAGLGTPPENNKLIAVIGRIYRLAHVSYFGPTIGYLPPAVFEPPMPEHGDDTFLAPIAAHEHSTRGGFRFAPFDWGELPDRKFAKAVSGFTVPLATPDGGGAVFSVADLSTGKAWAHRMKTARPEILRLAEFVHRQAMKSAGHAPETEVLSALELKVLQALATTADPSRISEKLGLADATFRLIADSARHKLEALTTAHALSIAMNRGLL